MTIPMTLSQASLATAVGLSAAGILAGTHRPNPAPRKLTSGADTIRTLLDAHQQYGYIPNILTSALALQHISMILTYPHTPVSILHNAATNGLQSDMFVWSKDTVIPMALILCIGLPLRLLSYGALGKNFTFELAAPDRLKTNGLYRYVQHPSYTGLLAIWAGMGGLWCRAGGIVSCFVAPSLFPGVQRLEPVWVALPLVLGMGLIFSRVKDEEEMLKRQFGAEWEAWHAKTARFIPFVF